MAVDNVRMRWATSAEHVSQAQRLRERVFCVEQGVPRELELDGLDDQALHLLARESARGELVGTLRLLVRDRTAKLGRVAVLPDWRRQGIASRMVRLALRRARRCDCAEVRLASQLEVVGLYEALGFTVESEPFEEVGIAHVWMTWRPRPRPRRTVAR
jgi:ElaA protein